MCGVCGRIELGSGPPVAAGSVHLMLEALTHRGPDDLWLAERGAAVLGATRLAIRGLGDGRQPMVDAQSGVTVVCNGEIDNSAELREWLGGRGRPVAQAADIAVLPGLYLELGESFLERLVGAFAIAVWDPRAGRLLLARDRAGERPLFYHRDGTVVRFATEIAALASDPAVRLTPDRSALAGYLRFGSFASPATPFVEIRKVAPAEVVVLSQEGRRSRRYWRWPVGDSAARTGAASLDLGLDRFDRIFRESVRRQSEVEVEYGVFLSGGVDSSLVAAVARAVRPDVRLRAFTLRFAEASYDEGDAASRVAEDLGLEQIPVWVTPEAVAEGISELVRLVGEPLADPAWVPTALLARRAAREVKVALVGEGADELFGGYPTYLGALLSGKFASLPRPARGAIRRLVELWPPSDKKVTLSFLLKRFVAGAEMGALSRHLLWTSNIPPALLRRLGIEEGGPPVLPLEEDAASHSPARLLDRIQRVDLETSLAEGLLTKADRASMQAALELRAPFLDLDVMEFAATLPPEERVHGITTKVFLKRYARRYLRKDVVHRKKRGLSVPLSGWLREPLRDWARERLGDARLRRAGVEPEAALSIFREHLERRADHARALWSVIVLSEWLRWSEERDSAADGAA